MTDQLIGPGPVQPGRMWCGHCKAECGTSCGVYFDVPNDFHATRILIGKLFCCKHCVVLANDKGTRIPKPISELDDHEAIELARTKVVGDLRPHLLDMVRRLQRSEAYRAWADQRAREYVKQINRLRGGTHDFPKIVCLCGSTRFKDAFLDAAREETLAGSIVLSVGFFSHADVGGHKEELLGQGPARALDELHLRKIDLADEILVINVGGYVGSSTANEIRYAKSQGKSVRYREPVEENAS
jgi:hypothetical protein